MVSGGPNSKSGPVYLAYSELTIMTNGSFLSSFDWSPVYSSSLPQRFNTLFSFLPLYERDLIILFCVKLCGLSILLLDTEFALTLSCTVDTMAPKQCY